MSRTEVTYTCKCMVGSNGKDDAENTKYFVMTDDGSGLMHTVPIERHQIVEVIEERSDPLYTGAPWYRQDRVCLVLLTVTQMKDLGWRPENNA